MPDDWRLDWTWDVPDRYAVLTPSGYRLSTWASYDLAWTAAVLGCTTDSYHQLFVTEYDAPTGRSGHVVSAANIYAEYPIEAWGTGG